MQTVYYAENFTGYSSTRALYRYIIESYLYASNRNLRENEKGHTNLGSANSNFDSNQLSYTKMMTWNLHDM